MSLIILILFIVFVLYIFASFNYFNNKSSEIANSWDYMRSVIDGRIQNISIIKSKLRDVTEMRSLDEAENLYSDANKYNSPALFGAAETKLRETLKRIVLTADDDNLLHATKTQTEIDIVKSTSLIEQYNNSVREYNKKLETAPTNLIGALFHFEKKQEIKTITK